MNAPLNKVSCPQCGRTVDDRAVACPQCGEKIYVEHPADITPTRHPPNSSLNRPADDPRKSRDGSPGE